MTGEMLFISLAIMVLTPIASAVAMYLGFRSGFRRGMQREALKRRIRG